MSGDVQVKWLGSAPNHNFGTTFGLPWSRGKHQPATTTFTCTSASGVSIPLQSWVTAYWPDGSIKWTAHAVSASKTVEESYSVHAITPQEATTQDLIVNDDESHTKLRVSDDELINVWTGKINVSFSKAGESIIHHIATAHGHIVGTNGKLVLLSQSSVSDRTIPDHGVSYHEFKGTVDDITVEQAGPVRVVIVVKGRHHEMTNNSCSTPREPWLPFILRFYLYADSEMIRMVHSIVYDGDANQDFIRGIGIRFDVPLEDEPMFDRHVRFSSVDGGVFSESPQGITGLRKDPGEQVRKAQVKGWATPSVESWDQDFVSRLQWVPVWNDYSLSQLSPDGFNLRKRTKEGHSWVNIPSGTKGGGLVYLGGATHGGLAIGLRDFWERYPTGLDVRNAGQQTGETTIWLYSPSAEPMDLRQYHDGLQQDTYGNQLDALTITYEDWEPGLGSPFGIARTNELFILATHRTPSSQTLLHLTEYMRNPPVLMAESEAIHQTGAFGKYWSASSNETSPVLAKQDIENNLEFLFRFYNTQIQQRRWYGFWDYGDIMHTYDEDRHTWRYDIGGYAWDNSELSPDIWLWLYFLRTRRVDVYRVAEALTRHTGEVDIYHIGKFKGLGTRHGVQHWSDSCKQARISNALYRRYFYYLSGGDERTGDLLREVLDTEPTFLTLDPYRKVRKDKQTYKPRPEAIVISLGTDWSALAAAWFVEWERKGPQSEDAKGKLLRTMKGIGSLTNGFVTGYASYNMQTGEISPPPQDPTNKGAVQVSHLSAMFGLFEICADLLDSFQDITPPGFEEAWLEYCRYFNASPGEQVDRFGVEFGNLILRQGHSRLTAYAAKTLSDKLLARRAWHDFFFGDGYGPDLPWRSELVDGHRVLAPVEEAKWISTNITALYGLAAIQNLALVEEELGNDKQPVDFL